MMPAPRPDLPSRPGPAALLVAGALLLAPMWGCTEGPESQSDRDHPAAAPAGDSAPGPGAGGELGEGAGGGSGEGVSGELRERSGEGASGGSGEGAAARDALHWPVETVEHSGPDGLEILLSHPEPEGDSPLEAAARGWALDRMTSPGFGEGTRAPTPEAAADSFAMRYMAYREEVPDGTGRWFLDRQIRVEVATPRWVTLSVEESVHMGGAHPSYALGWVNLDTETGAVLDLDALVVDDARPELMAAVEAQLRAGFELEPDQPLSEAGFFDDILREPGTFALEPDGIRFLWNPYEIGPWAMGPVEVRLAWAEVAPFLRDPGLVDAAGQAFTTGDTPGSAGESGTPGSLVPTSRSAAPQA